MKETIIAITLGLIFGYEIIVLTRMKSFIRLMYSPIEEKSSEQKAKVFAVSMFNFMYFVFVVMGMAFGTQWHMYSILFALSVGQYPILRFFRDLRHGSTLTLAFRYADSLASIYVIILIFLNHFHG